MLEKLDWLTKESRIFLKEGYTYEQKAEDRFNEMISRLQEIIQIEGFDKKIETYLKNHWLSFASPEISNLGKDKGLPASCNFLKIQDTIESINSSEFEMAMLAANGAGTARNYSNIRPYGAKYGNNGLSEGVMSWIESHALKIKKISQNGTRRGFLTAYLSVSHKEILDFLKIGREGHNITNITTGVTIPNGWMQEMLDGNKEYQKIFKEIHASRAEIGYPYILFEDNCNKGKHQVYIDNDLWLDTSNICTECVEYTDAEKEFLCVLLSINLQHWDEFKDTDFIFDCNLILDAITTDYIEKAKHLRGHEKAVKYAEEHRAIGLGVMGFADYLQQNMISIGSMKCMSINYNIFKKIREESDRASRWMATNWGVPKMLIGYGDRNTSRIAIAPTKSSSAIMGFVSEGTQPIKNNYHIKDLAKIQIEWKNPNLQKLLKEYNKDIKSVWENILLHKGSVQQLDFLSQHEKDVFKTSFEISQMDLVNMAAQRQQFIDQSQSLNLTISSNDKAKDIIKLTVEAWRKGIKTLYYQYNINSAQNYTSNILTCSSCEA